MPLALLQLREAATWWEANRPLAPDTFVDAVRDALDRLAESPAIGVRAFEIRREGVRRYYMRRVGYHLYYRVHGDTVEVLAFWHASRGTGPPI